MNTTPLKKLKIDDFGMLLQVYASDENFHNPYNESTYLNLNTGDLKYLYLDDDDAEFAECETGIPASENIKNRNQVLNNPNDYLEISGADHGTHHEILIDFIHSNWTNDQTRKQNAINAYHKSIGWWIKELEKIGEHEAVDKYHKYKAQILEKRCIEFLNTHGIDPV